MSTSAFQEAKLIFTHYKDEFEKYLDSVLNRFDFEGNDLEKACRYALTCGGKRFRPILVLLIANSCGKGFSMDAALSVELFHTSSLIIDDLPCMDDDDSRRGKPSTHSAFGEGVAILSTYSLISEAFDSILRNVEHSRGAKHPYINTHDLGAVALRNVCKNLGTRGITGGQYLDLYCEDLTQDKVLQTLEMKTAALFETSFVLGWIFGGGDPKYLPLVEKLALHFGLAFQIADDIDDYEKDMGLGRKMNLAISLGKEKAQGSFQDHIIETKRLISELPIDSKELELLCEYLNIKGNS